MTIASKLIELKDIEAQKPISAEKPTLIEKPAPTEAKGSPTKQPKATRGLFRAIVVVNASQKRRRQQRRNTTACFIGLITLLVVFDVFVILSADRNCPIVQLTGIYPSSLSLLMLLSLHLMTLMGGLSKTVRGCRLAMGISWVCFIISIFCLLFIPSFIGSSIGSGLNPVNYNVFPATSSNDRFENAFYSALLSQMIAFTIFLASANQLILVGHLLVEARRIENALRIAQKASALGGERGAGDVLLPAV
uniref:G_PROTEIN_RECEP_F1_2 domain-containing protein n=1 Tax=Caenorhabditis tropicalis TaxID=1561998 RepID=A0A1I7TNN9_9PELO